jgi:hypothetical protein
MVPLFLISNCAHGETVQSQSERMRTVKLYLVAEGAQQLQAHSDYSQLVKFLNIQTVNIEKGRRFYTSVPGGPLNEKSLENKSSPCKFTV